MIVRHFLDYISTLDKEHKKANSISPGIDEVT
jgi:hypothetical protein